MKTLIRNTFLFLSLGLFLACSDDDDLSSDDDGGGGGQVVNGYGIIAENTGTGQFHVLKDGRENMGVEDMVYCYTEGCEDITWFRLSQIEEGQEWPSHFTDVDREAVGIRVTLEIEEGEGRLHLARGTSSSELFQEFEAVEIIESSGILSVGDTYSFEHGNVN